MKTHLGFISNSSSTSFIITNKTIHPLPLREFVEENIHLVDDFNKMYTWHNYKAEELLEAVKNYDYILKPGQNTCEFGDEDGNVLGEVYDYILQESGSSKRFGWCFNESHH